MERSTDSSEAPAWAAARSSDSDLVLIATTPWLRQEFFGYGYAGALLIVCVLGLLVLDRVFERLEYETFMLQPGA